MTRWSLKLAGASALFLSGREAGLPPIYFLLNMPDSAMPHAWLADHQPQTQQ